ncbi:GGDEF domain-containing protein [Desulfotomaculum sp. 1211_IL3151]|uniref:GGDEF domain-containing protein n=1 Tax=Desulfotomaculum sp. 1211_IL3151 TaxID=3084055 RepID=UPI002FD92AFE
MFHANNSVLGECALINTNRIYYLSIIAIPLRIINIFLFTLTVSHDTLVLKTWSQGIIASHFILLIFMIGFFLTTRKLKNRKEPNTTMFVLQYIAVIVIMASGIAIVTLDQLVTTNITPFLLICLISGVVFLIKPLISFIIYLTSYVAYYYLIALTITNQQVLLSNRVNGITAVGLGFLLSIILWHYNYTNITQRWRIERQQKQLEQMAYYDPLTSLPNRRFFDKLIKQEFSSMQRQGHESVIIILDIDNFKNVNDTYGHPVGDNILRQLAILLANNVRESNTVSRFGGEEFVILMPETSLEEGYAFAERLRKLIMEERFIIGSIKLRITSSFGVSLLSDIKSESLEDYYYLADKALYLAKQCGKNRVEIACGSAEMADPGKK